MSSSLAGSSPKVRIGSTPADAPREWPSDRVVAVELDVRDTGTIARATAEASDATILLHNDGMPEWPPVTLGGGDLSAVAAHLDTNVVGVIRLASAFAPVLADAPRGVILMVYSVQAWINLSGAYAVSQAALSP
ncbi:SDR family NAD(P)-dependent oxidoreductase [Micromonospora sp. NPDC050417]|uniref:SDR family NAD(P)-dependent oxidoreductase n=1 Tax=Micromonospora sp. NPDC050417 TaxID=3364280 RepID=UPI003791B2D8